MVGLAAPARAQDEPEPIRIAFAAPPGCPDELAFTTELRSRTPRARPAWQGEPARTFRVTITRHRETTLGNLTIEEPGGGSNNNAVREVTGRTCSEVVSALALITAIAIDPHASTAAHLPAFAPGLPVSGLPRAPWDAGLPGDLAPPSLRLAPTAETGAAMVPPPLPAWVPPPRVAKAGFRVTTGAEVQAHGGTGPTLHAGSSVFVELGRSETSLLLPTFRLSGISTSGGTVSLNHAEGSFLFKAITLDGCPLQIALQSFVRVFPCAGLEAGVIEAQGDSAAFYSQRTRAWIAPDLVARSEWTIVEHFVLEVQGGAVFPLLRDRYLLTSTTIGYAVPGIAGVVGVGLGVRFP